MKRHLIRPALILILGNGMFALAAADGLGEPPAEPPAAGPYTPVTGPDGVADDVTLDRSALDLFSLGDREGDSASALFALARIKQETGEYLEALQTWEEALDLVRDRYGRWDQRNVTALAGMGASYRGLDRYQEALEFYGQAVYINRMNQGLHDASQLTYLDRISELHALRNEWQEATQLQEYAYYVHQRDHGDDTPEILPAINRLAEWYQRTGALLSARGLYERAVSIIEEHYGPDDIRLVEPLQRLAMTYRMERYPPAAAARREEPSFRVSAGGPGPERDPFVMHQRQPLNPYGVGERALVRSVELQLEHPDIDHWERAEALLELGDWYLLFDKWNQAMRTYARAREVLREADVPEEEVTAVFDEPVALVFPVPPAPSPAPWTEGVRSHEGFVSMVYDVTDRGRLRNLDITDAEPEGLLDFRLRRSVRAARFRPRFVDDAPVAAEGVAYRHQFVYYTQPRQETARQEQTLQEGG